MFSQQAHDVMHLRTKSSQRRDQKYETIQRPALHAITRVFTSDRPIETLQSSRAQGRSLVLYVMWSQKWGAHFMSIRQNNVCVVVFLFLFFFIGFA